MTKETQQINYVKDTFEEYLSKKDHISSSDIKNFLKCPAYYHHEKYGESVKEKGRHFSIGSAIHEIILEPELFHSNYIVSPKFDRRTTKGKADAEEFELNAKGKTVITDDEMELVIGIAEQSMKNKTFVELIKESYKEVSVYSVDETTGLKLKVRPDALAKNKNTIIDIKSCNDGSLRGFKKDVYSYGYYISAPYYLDVLKRENYVFASMEKSKPYPITLYVLNDEMMEHGRKQYRMALDLLKWSYDNNFWCDYNHFELLKECYDLGNLNDFFDTLNNSDLITIIQ
jgi:hypothetical protein